VPLPTMHINPDVTDIFSFIFDDFELKGYRSANHITAPVSV
jgi:thymidylate synthase